MVHMEAQFLGTGNALNVDVMSLLAFWGCCQSRHLEVIGVMQARNLPQER
jgi:hypothetical protein